MALPPVEKQWQHVFNIDSGSDTRQILIDRAKALCGLASYGGQLMTANLWASIKSCNGSSVVSGFNWNSVSDMVHGNDASTNAHSWILLQNALGRQWLLDYRGTDNSQFYMKMSPGGLFTGGTTTSAPTATDQLDKDPSHGSWSLYDTSTAPRMLQNIWLSPDGKQTMIACVHNSTNLTFFLFGDLEDVPADVAHPTIMWGDGRTDGVGASFWEGLVGFSGGIHLTVEETPGLSGSAHFIGEAVNVDLVNVNNLNTVAIKNQLSNRWDIFEKSYVQSTREGTWGQLGYWPDLWPTVRSQTGFATGDHFPEDGVLPTRQYVKFGNLILPWFGAPQMVKL